MALVGYGMQNDGKWKLYLRGNIEMKPWVNLGIQEGANGGCFTLKWEGGP